MSALGRCRSRVGMGVAARVRLPVRSFIVGADSALVDGRTTLQCCADLRERAAETLPVDPLRGPRSRGNVWSEKIRSGAFPRECLGCYRGVPRAATPEGQRPTTVISKLYESAR